MAVISGQKRQFVKEVNTSGVITETELAQHVADYHVVVAASLAELSSRTVKYDGQFGIVDTGTSRTTYQYNSSTNTWVEFISSGTSAANAIDGGSPTTNPSATAFKIDFGSVT